MTQLTITSFHNIRNKANGFTKSQKRSGYRNAGSYLLDIERSIHGHSLVQHMDNLTRQARLEVQAPTGVSFSAWQGEDNRDDNFLTATALAIDYHNCQFQALRAAALATGWEFFLIATEDKAAKSNAWSLVVPFRDPVGKSTYERVASCIVNQLAVYGLFEGALAVNHIINIHASTFTIYERGQLLDAEAYKVRTAQMYQQPARRFEATQAPQQTIAAPTATAPVTQLDDTGLFEFPLSAKELLARDADSMLARHGIRLPN